jgi:N4-gp56 family major capsid protein
MAVTLSDGATITTLLPSYLKRKWLKRHEAELVYDEWAQQEPIPMGEGRTVVWHQFLNLSEGYTVGEGSPPAASTFSTRKVSATLVEKAQLRGYSNVTADSSVLPIVSELMDALGYNGAFTKDAFISQQIGYGSTFSVGATNAASAFHPSIYSQGFPIFSGDSDTSYWPPAGGGAVIGFTTLMVGVLSTTPVIAHLRKAAIALENMDAIRFPDGNWRGIIHPTASGAIRSDTLWPTWNAFSNRAGALQKGMLGIIEGILFKESTKAFTATLTASAWSNLGQLSTGGTMYGTLVFGQGAYGVTKLAGKDVTVRHIPPEKYDKSDVLGQTGYAGYLFPVAAKVLNPSAGLIYSWYKPN